eukprot:TRINITY_DN43752_c0_g1_i1.p1 TRINITY_DN43752_c0_g1~~TRINITY_DN43752_c0_g1_i1.p1  ORF type:complete len:107 (+),score=18.91 TRINITY_DN43752_c0_g1_i1:77-397(+)
MAATSQDCKRLTIVSGGRNHIRDYVEIILKEATAMGGPRSVLLCAKLKAISKAISVAEVSKRAAEDQGFSATTIVNMNGMREEGPDRRELPEIEIRINFEPMKTDT